MKKEKHKEPHIEEEIKRQTDEALNPRADELADLKARAEAAETKLNQVLHAKADFENAKKRLEKEKEDFIKFANDALIMKLLPIIDNFRLAVNSMDDKHKLDDIITGIKLIEKQLEDALKEFGLEPIMAVGNKFDPHLEEAVAHEETDEFEDGVVTQELQRGYLLAGRLLRPAMVKVAKNTKDKN
jgi:molecular chaperone GrpE